MESNPKTKVLDNIVMGASILYPLMSIPQVYNIWFLKDIQGVSLLTWVLFTIFTIPMLIYTIVHKIKPFIVMNILWLTVYAFIIAGILIHG